MSSGEWLVEALISAAVGISLLVLHHFDRLPVEAWARQSRISTQDMRRGVIFVGAAACLASAVSVALSFASR